MQKDTIQAAKAHAEAAFPHESCGFVLQAADGTELYRPVPNSAAAPGESFRIDGAEYIAAEEAGDIKAVVHSHPGGPDGPTVGDRVACENSRVPWYVIPVHQATPGAPPKASTPVGIVPNGYRAPLLGRPFFHGVLDCYTLIRDWFDRERGVELPDYERPDDWWNHGLDLYLANLEHAGFRILTEREPMKTGDMVLMQVRSPVANHGGLFLGDEGLSEAPDLFPLRNAMLHHFYGRNSERVVYGGMWASCTRMVCRHKSQE